MSDTLLRQWAMLRRIPRYPHKIDARSLREKLCEVGFDINLRTIQRDLEALSCQFPILCDDRDKPFGWSWERNALQDMPGMDPPTALTFVLAHRFLEELLPRSSLRYLIPYFRQGEKTLRNLGKQGLAKWPDKVRILPRGQKLLPAEIQPNVITVVYEALLEERQFRVSYQSRGEQEYREYEVNPLGLVFRGAAIYLVCTFWDYDDIRQLAMHRMRNASMLDKRRRIPGGFTIDQYISEGEFSYPVASKYIRLKVRFTEGAAIHLYESPLSKDQTITNQNDGWVFVEATVQDTKELRWWLLGFGDQAVVLKPLPLRNDIRQNAFVMTAHYNEPLPCSN